MDQSVMTFAGTAARGSAISSPVEGMLTYMQDTNKYQYYDSTWKELDTTPGWKLIDSRTVGTASSISIDNIFTSEYRVYKILGTTISTSNVERFSTRYLKASDGTSSTASAVDGFAAQPLGGSGVISIGATSTTTHVIGIAGTGKNSIELTCFEPFQSTQTVTTCFANGNTYYGFGASHQAAESERGIIIAHTVGIWNSAEFRIYGLRD